MITLPSGSPHLFAFLPILDCRRIQKIALVNSNTQTTKAFIICEGQFLGDITPEVGKAKFISHLFFPLPPRTHVQKEWRHSFKALMQEWSEELQQANIQLNHTLQKLNDRASIPSGDMQAVREKVELVRALINQETVWNERKGAVQALVKSHSSLDSAKVRRKLEEQQKAINKIFHITLEEVRWIDKMICFIRKTAKHFEKQKEKLSRSEIEFLIDLSQFLNVLPSNRDVFNFDCANRIHKVQQEILEIIQMD
jgi:hypothetical protein